MPELIMAIDQGTTSSRAILFDRNGLPVAQAQKEFTQHYPQSGWVEHDPEDLWQSTLLSCREAIATADIQADDIRTIGISNQRETTLVWNRLTGKPVHRAIVWQDRRTTELCRQMDADGHGTLIHERTGLLLDPYFSATKISWILDHVEGARAAAEKGELAFGTVDSFLLWRLTGGRSHYTDASNASRTLLFNIHQQCWDQELLDLFRIPASMLPEVRDNADDFGETQAEFLGAAIPVQGMAGDQQAAAFGQCCFAPGMAKSTYGTGCFLILNTGSEAISSSSRLLTTVAYRLHGVTTYALEGSIFMAGATIQWLRDGLKLFSEAAQSESLARQASEDLSVFMVPAFTGLGAPYWDPDARGAIYGLTRDAGVNELAAAALLSVCYQTKDLQKAMEADGQRPTRLRVDGGMSENDFLLQNLADVLGSPVDRPRITETTALGAAYLAGLHCGLFESLGTITEKWQLDRSFGPKQDKAWRDQRYAGWRDAVGRTRSQRSEIKLGEFGDSE